jgi:hypothetical protein
MIDNVKSCTEVTQMAGDWLREIDDKMIVGAVLLKVLCLLRVCCQFVCCEIALYPVKHNFGKVQGCNIFAHVFFEPIGA